MLWNTSPHLVDTLHPSHLCRTFIILLSWWQIINKDYPSRPHALLPSPCPPRSIDLLSSSPDTMSNVTIVGPKGEIKTSDLNDLIVKSINSQAFIGAFTSLIAAATPPPPIQLIVQSYIQPLVSPVLPNTEITNSIFKT